jgi:simple sugar transport system ATP-binding protein
MTTVLRLENISKSYGLNPALNRVCMEVQAGEIHGLVGENGSGKTTLLNILIGNPVIRETGGYQGSIFLDGKRVKIDSPYQALSLGIGMVHQECALLPGLTVGQNIRLGREYLMPATRFLGKDLALVDRRRDDAQAKACLHKMGVELEPGLKPGSLPVNIKHYIELARELSRQDLRVLVLDEPTAGLSIEDARRLRPVLQEILGRDTAIIFVSHRLEELLEVCQSITVLRDGQIEASLRQGNPSFTVESITFAMVGHTAAQKARKSAQPCGPAILRFEDFAVDMPGDAIRRLNLEVRQGEILGLAGLSGHGKAALGYGLMGMCPTSGRVMMGDCELDLASVADVNRAGICCLPDDRRRSGLLGERSVMENIIFTAAQQKNRFLKRKFKKLLSGRSAWSIGKKVPNTAMSVLKDLIYAARAYTSR